MPATAAISAAPHRSAGGGPRSDPAPNGARPARSAGGRDTVGRGGARPATKDHEILSQRFFKSVGPRTYAAQVKRAANGNHYLVLMEGKRDDKTGEVRKTRLFIYSEDFVEFFRLVKSTAEFIKANPVPEAIRVKREKFWAAQGGAAPAPGVPSPRAPATVPPPAPAARAV